MKEMKPLLTAILVVVFHTICFGEIFETKKGTLEVFGLHSMKPAELFSKLEALDPKNPVCMVGLEKLGFPSFHVRKELNGDRFHWHVTVVDLGLEKNIKPRPIPENEISLPDRWSELAKLYQDHDFEYTLAMQIYPLFLTGNQASLDELFQALTNQGWEKNDLDTLRKIWNSICTLDTENDRESALRILLNGKEAKNRLIAGSVLTNFHRSDSTWWALVEALRYPDTQIPISGILATVLDNLAEHFPRKIDWTASIPSIRALIDGTNPGGFLSMLKVLNKTQISSLHAVPLLQKGGVLVVDHLASSSPANRDSARQFLVTMAGRDLGLDPGAWKKWIEALPANTEN